MVEARAKNSMILAGTRREIADEISRLGERGLDFLIINMQCATLDATLERMARFADDVRPKVAA
ncbi:MAG: hypothetical protein FJX61_02295 [Alphaproteobacteria bacterium]|nr:hypothetical protein [Alphaproteobacteria bacterium]